MKQNIKYFFMALVFLIALPVTILGYLCGCIVSWFMFGYQAAMKTWNVENY